jgi:hypothetical protein
MTQRAMDKWNYDEDRTYHGVQRDDDAENDRIEIELAEYGPTERASVYVLQTLYENPHPPLDGYQLGWGHNGGGTSATALVILRDALGEEPSLELREAFCEDVLSQFCDEFRIRRSAVLRWARGWCAERGIDELPRAVRELPPISRLHYASRPEAIRQAQRRKSGDQ